MFEEKKEYKQILNDINNRYTSFSMNVLKEFPLEDIKKIKPYLDGKKDFFNYKDVIDNEKTVVYKHKDTTKFDELIKASKTSSLIWHFLATQKCKYTEEELLKLCDASREDSSMLLLNREDITKEAIERIGGIVGLYYVGSRKMCGFKELVEQNKEKISNKCFELMCDMSDVWQEDYEYMGYRCIKDLNSTHTLRMAKWIEDGNEIALSAIASNPNLSIPIRMKAFEFCDYEKLKNETQDMVKIIYQSAVQTLFETDAKEIDELDIDNATNCLSRIAGELSDTCVADFIERCKCNNSYKHFLIDIAVDTNNIEVAKKLVKINDEEIHKVLYHKDKVMCGDLYKELKFISKEQKDTYFTKILLSTQLSDKDLYSSYFSRENFKVLKVMAFSPFTPKWVEEKIKEINIPKLTYLIELEYFLREKGLIYSYLMPFIGLETNKADGYINDKYMQTVETIVKKEIKGIQHFTYGNKECAKKHLKEFIESKKSKETEMYNKIIEEFSDNLDDRMNLYILLKKQEMSCFFVDASGYYNYHPEYMSILTDTEKQRIINIINMENNINTLIAIKEMLLDGIVNKSSKEEFYLNVYYTNDLYNAITDRIVDLKKEKLQDELDDMVGKWMNNQEDVR